MKTFILWLIMQASPTSSTTGSNSISYSPIVQNFYYYPKKTSPSVAFHLYDVAREMSLRDFCAVCKIPFEGSLEEPHHKDVDGFIDTITVGESRKVSDARITSIYFPILRYFAIFASRCLIGRGNCGTLVFLILFFCSMLYSVINLLVWVLLLLNN